MRIRKAARLVLRGLLGAGVLAIPPFFSCLAATPPTAEITVDAGASLGPVNPLVFGHNIEAAAGEGIFGGTYPNVLRTGTGFWDPAARAPVPTALAEARDIGMKMLRYPGGCLVHNFDWRKAVGPPEGRGDWQFGVDEFIALCRAIGAEPMITISDYALPPEEMPRNAAELVEYLNAEATPTHPWAAKRRQWGHAQPYGVKWFELGNESVHGNHQTVPQRTFTPERYAQYALETARAMRAVDPSIKIGIVTVPGNLLDVDNPWNTTVVHLAGQAADYVVVHLYAPDYTKRSGEDDLMAACMALPDQAEARLGRFRAMIRRECGRDLLLAVTEYNIGAVQEKPRPYRFSMGAALMCADLIRVFLKPANAVATANYWQFIGGYWGMVSERPDGPGRPAFPFFRLWGRHFGTELIDVKVAGPTASAKAFPGVEPADADAEVPGGEVVGAISAEQIRRMARLAGPTAEVTPSVDTQGNFVFTLHHLSKEAYPHIVTVPQPDGAGGDWECRVFFDARFVSESRATAQVGLGAVDPRGYDETQSAVALTVSTGSEWASCSGNFTPLPDAPGVAFVARLLDKGKLDGRFEIRNLRLDFVRQHRLAKFPLLTASASRSADGSKIYLIVFNRSATQEIQATIHVHGDQPTSGKVWEVTGPSLAATEGVRESKSGEAITPVDGNFLHAFPPRSMTAIECTAKSVDELRR